jgi:hypothetical protein
VTTTRGSMAKPYWLVNIRKYLNYENDVDLDVHVRMF